MCRGGELGTGQGRTAASPLPRAGPCAPRITSQPPPLPPRLAQRTAQLELPCGHMPKALSLPLWMDWRGVKPLHQAADLRRKGDLPFPGCALPELPATGTGRGLFPARVPASLPSSPRRDSLVQTGRGPLLPCPALPRFSPRPAPNSFQHLYGQVQSRSNFFLLLSLSCVRDCG